MDGRWAGQSERAMCGLDNVINSDSLAPPPPKCVSPHDFVSFTLCVILVCVDNGTPGGFSNDGSGGGGGSGVSGAQQSGVVGSLSLSVTDATPAGSPDPSSLTVLQPANNNQNNGTVYAAAAPTMLPGFTTHYATTGKYIAQPGKSTSLSPPPKKKKSLYFLYTLWRRIAAKRDVYLSLP